MSGKDFIPFALPDIGEEEINEVVDSLRSGWVTTGPKTRKFESDFSSFINADIASLAVNSATSGLHLALEAIGVSDGDEVITTPYTFTATAEVIRYLGAHPVFVDINPETLNIDATKIESKITTKTKAIIPVHIAGLSCDMGSIIKIAKKYNLKVVEDAAHSLPTTYKKKIIGSLETDATVFSFYATKTIATGEGGMITTSDPSIAKRCSIMRLHGIDRDAFDRYHSDKPSWYYEIIAPGFKYNMTDIAASMGIHQLKKAYAFQKKRQTIAEYYDESFKDLPVILPPKPLNGDMHAWHLYTIRLSDDAKISRDDFICRMSEEGIGTSVHFIPLFRHPYWRDTYKLTPEQFPFAEQAYQKIVSLPIYTKLNELQIEQIQSSVRKILLGK